jgi:hypothetical protein
MQFIDEQNVAGQTLLRLVSRANAIIAELLRLSAHIPPVFKLEDKLTQRKYGDILLDFSYVGKSDYFETKIERDPVCTLYFNLITLLWLKNDMTLRKGGSIHLEAALHFLTIF